MGTIDQSQENLEWWQSLPYPFTECVVSRGIRPEGFRFYSDIINIEAVIFDKKLLVCGEDNDVELAMTKAVAELLERAALVMWNRTNPKNKKSSNGWAAHQTIAEAKQAATFELIERDAVLAQWYSSTPFLEIDPHDMPISIQKWRDEELVKSEFPILRILLSTKGIGPSVTCVLMNKSGFGVSSHATRESLDLAIESAIAEACRSAHLYLRRAFWNDSVALQSGPSGEIDPVAHAVYYAYHESLPDWMFGDVLSWKSANQFWRTTLAKNSFDEFRFERISKDPIVVGFVENTSTFELRWGPTDISLISNMAASRRLSPNKKEWNLKPHIIS
jgi:hypothetical protein